MSGRFDQGRGYDGSGSRSCGGSKRGGSWRVGCSSFGERRRMHGDAMPVKVEKRLVTIRAKVLASWAF